jgi:hypothetical protein
MEQQHGLQQISVSTDVNDFLVLLAATSDGEEKLDSDPQEPEIEAGTQDINVFPSQQAAYKFAVAHALASGLPRKEKSGDSKNKWQTPAIYDESMSSLLDLYGIKSTSEKHVHYMMVELAEAGLRDLKEKIDSGYDIWDLISESP